MSASEQRPGEEPVAVQSPDASAASAAAQPSPSPADASSAVTVPDVPGAPGPQELQAPGDPVQVSAREAERRRRQEEPPVGRRTPEQQESGEGADAPRSEMELRILAREQEGRPPLMRRVLPRLVLVNTAPVEKDLREKVQRTLSRLGPGGKSQRMKEVLIASARDLYAARRDLTVEQAWQMSLDLVLDIIRMGPLYVEAYLREWERLRPSPSVERSALPDAAGVLREAEEDAEIAAVVRHPYVQWLIDQVTRTEAGRAPDHELACSLLLDCAFSSLRRSVMSKVAKELRGGHLKMNWMYAYPNVPPAPPVRRGADGRLRAGRYCNSTVYDAVEAVIDKTPSDGWARVRLAAYNEKLGLQDKRGRPLRPNAGRVLQLDAFDLDADVAKLFAPAEWRRLDEELRGPRLKLVKYRAKAARTRKDRQKPKGDGLDAGNGDTYKEALDGWKVMVLLDPDDMDILLIRVMEGTGNEREVGWEMLTWAMRQAPALAGRLEMVAGDALYENDVALSARIIDRLRAIPVFPDSGVRLYSKKGTDRGVPLCTTPGHGHMHVQSIYSEKGGKGATGFKNLIGPGARERLGAVSWPLPEPEPEERWNPQTGKGGWILGDLVIRWRCPKEGCKAKDAYTRPGEDPCVYSMLPRAGTDDGRFTRAAVLAHRNAIESMNALLRRRGNAGRHAARLGKASDARVQWLLDAEATFLVLRKLVHLDGAQHDDLSSYELARQEMDAYGWLADTPAVATPPVINGPEAWEERARARRAAREPGKEEPYRPSGYSRVEREWISRGARSLIGGDEQEVAEAA